MRSSRAGFALLEALASLTVLAMAAMLLMQGVGVGRRVWESSDRRTQDRLSVETAQEFIRERLEHAYPETATDASTPFVRFVGKADRVEFLATPPWDEPGQGIRRYVLTLGPGGELQMTSAGGASGREAAQTPVLDNVRALDIAYYGAAAPDNVARWRPAWSAQRGLPAAVRIRLEFAEGDERRWTDLIVKPEPTIDTSCILLASTGRCRGEA